MTERWRTAIPVLGFTVGYVIAAAVMSVALGNREFLFYVGVMVVLLGVVFGLHARFTLPRAVMWALSGWGLLHMAGGLVPVPEAWPISGEARVLYSWWLVPGWLKFDHVVHTYGFGVTTWVVWVVLRRIIARLQGRDVGPTIGLLVICVAAAMGFGAVNEIIEFAATLLIPETNVGGYVNTGWDLVANAAGATISALLIRVLSQRTDESESP